MFQKNMLFSEYFNIKNVINYTPECYKLNKINNISRRAYYKHPKCREIHLASKCIHDTNDINMYCNTII